MHSGAQVEGLHSAPAGVAVGETVSDLAQQGPVARHRLPDQQIGRVGDRCADRLAAWYLAEAFTTLGVGDDGDVAREVRRVRTAQVEQHRVVAGDGHDLDLGNRGGHGRRSSPSIRRVKPHGLSSRRASWQHRRGHILVGDGPLEPLDGQAADRCAAGVRGRRERAAVNHRVADLDPGRPAVEQDPAGLQLQDREQPRRVRCVAVGGVHGRGELAFDGLEVRHQVVDPVETYDDPGGAEDLVRDASASGRTPPAAGRAPHRRMRCPRRRLVRRGLAQASRTRSVSRGDAGGQHGGAGGVS